MATGSATEIEEERRLFYVACTRAKDYLYVCFPLRYYKSPWSHNDAHGYAQVTRFITEGARDTFAEHDGGTSRTALGDAPADPAVSGEAIRGRLRAMWS